MQILYTSGTTGDPKAILTSHRRYAISATLPAVFGLNADDCIYTGLSLTHANAQVISLGMVLHTGIRGVISRKFPRDGQFARFNAEDFFPLEPVVFEGIHTWRPRHPLVLLEYIYGANWRTPNHVLVDGVWRTTDESG